MHRVSLPPWFVGVLLGVGACAPGTDGADPPAATVDTGPEDTTTGDTATGGDSPPPTGSPPGILRCDGGTAAYVAGRGFVTVEGALALAPVGETVVVCPGRWEVNLVIDRPVHIAGHGAPRLTVLDGGGRGRVIDRSSHTGAGALRLSNLTVTGGWTDGDGGGIRVGTEWSPLILEHVYLVDNEAGGSGGGLWANGSTTLDHVRFEGNRAGVRGGGALAWVENAVWEVTDSVFEGNSASYGGGLAVWEPEYRTGGGARVWRSSFVANTARTQGGGAYGVSDGLDIPVISCSDCDFRENLADQGGGLFAGQDYPGVEVTSSRFEGNHANVGGGVATGIGLFRDVWFDGNVAEVEAGALDVIWGWLELRRADVSRNQAPVGAGVLVRTYGGLDFRDVTWGAAEAANVEDDVRLESGTSFSELGGPLTGTCVDTGCTFTP